MMNTVTTTQIDNLAGSEHVFLAREAGLIPAPMSQTPPVRLNLNFILKAYLNTILRTHLAEGKPAVLTADFGLDPELVFPVSPVLGKNDSLWTTPYAFHPGMPVLGSPAPVSAGHESGFLFWPLEAIDQISISESAIKESGLHGPVHHDSSIAFLLENPSLKVFPISNSIARVRNLGDMAGAIPTVVSSLSDDPINLHFEPAIQNTDHTVLAELVEDRFQELVKQWHEETDGLSSPSKIASHPAYLRIISMGPPVVGLILRELESNGGYWYPALRALTEANPVPENAKGKPRLIKAEWLAWGSMHGYL